MFVEAIFVSVVMGLIRGGKVRRLKYLNYRNMWILLAGIVIQYILIVLSNLQALEFVANIMDFSKEILILSYVLILLGIISNIKYKSLWLILGGYFANFIVLWTNNFMIPILSNGGNLAETSIYTPIVQGTKLAFLGNTIAFTNPYPLAKIISMGDLIVGFGVFLLVQEIMLGKDSIMRRRRA